MTKKTIPDTNNVENVVKRIPCLENAFAIKAGTIMPIPLKTKMANGIAGYTISNNNLRITEVINKATKRRLPNKIIYFGKK